MSSRRVHLHAVDHGEEILLARARSRAPPAPARADSDGGVPGIERLDALPPFAQAAACARHAARSNPRRRRPAGRTNRFRTSPRAARAAGSASRCRTNCPRRGLARRRCRASAGVLASFIGWRSADGAGARRTAEATEQSFRDAERTERRNPKFAEADIFAQRVARPQQIARNAAPSVTMAEISSESRVSLICAGRCAPSSSMAPVRSASPCRQASSCGVARGASSASTLEPAALSASSGI